MEVIIPLVWTPFPEGIELEPSDMSRTEGPGERLIEHVCKLQGLIAKHMKDGRNDVEVYDPVTGLVCFYEVKGISQRKFRLSRSRKSRVLLRELFIDPLADAARYVISLSDYTEFVRNGGEITHKNLEHLRNFIDVDDSVFFRAYFSAANIGKVVLIDKKRGYCVLDVDLFCQAARIYNIGDGLPRIEIRKEYYGVQERRRGKGVASSSGKPVRKRSVRRKVGGVDSDDLQQTTAGAGGAGVRGGDPDRTPTPEGTTPGGDGRGLPN